MHRVKMVKYVLMCYEGGEVVRVVDLKDSQGLYRGCEMGSPVALLMMRERHMLLRPQRDCVRRGPNIVMEEEGG